MTATEVDGLPVVKDEPGVAPFRDRAGAPVYQPQTRVLTLADGSVVYGCAHCDYTSRNPHSIRPHLGKHNGRRHSTAGKPGPGGVLDLPLTELMDRLQQLETVITERNAWKVRAQAAEKRLRQLRNALGVTEQPPPPAS